MIMQTLYGCGMWSSEVGDSWNEPLEIEISERVILLGPKTIDLLSYSLRKECVHMYTDEIEASISMATR